MNSELDDAIRSASADIVANAPPAGVAPTQPSALDGSHRSGRWMLAGVGALLVLGLVGTLVAVAARTDPADTSTNEVVVSPAPSTPDNAVVAATTAPEPVPDPTSGDVPGGLRARCDTMTFELIDGNVALEQLAPLDADAQAALVFAESQGELSGYERSQFDWRVGTITPEQISLLGIPTSPAAQQFATASVLRDGDTYQTILPGVGAMGYCTMAVEADGWSRGSLTLDPNTPISPDATSLTVLATERACASRRIPPASDVYTNVDETASEIRILVMVRNVVGGARCPTNPSFPIEVQLDEVVGTRTTVDASVIPAATLSEPTPTPAPTDPLTPTNSVGGTAPLTPAPLRCDTDLDQIVELLQSGQITYDYTAAADLEDLVQRSDIVLTGTLDSFVRETSPDSITEERIVLRSSDARILKSESADQPAVDVFSSPTAWANRPEADPIAEPILVDGVSFIAFLHQSNEDPNAFVVGAQSLQIACAGSPEPTIAITAPLPADASAFPLNELVEAIN